MAQRKIPKRTRQKRTGPLRSSARKTAERAAARAATPRARARAEAQTAREEAPSQKLHKVLAQAGFGSRRAMEGWIKEGKVTVNGVVPGIGTRVGPTDLVRVGHNVVRWPTTGRLPKVLLYHKPEGEIVTQSDPEGRATVFERLPTLRGAKWLAVGRLDYNTSGLLIFTTSGDLANRMMHPRFEVEREYAVRLVGVLNANQLQRLTTGIPLSDGVAKCESVKDEGGEGTNHWYRIVLKEGRNRVVRRMFESMGLTVSRLMRVRFGAVSLPSRLKRGQSSAMSPAEVKGLLAWLDEIAPQKRQEAPPA